MTIGADTDEKVRAKRSMSLEHNVELMIVTDKTMVDYHGENLESYVLYLVAVVCHTSTFPFPARDPCRLSDGD